MPEQTVIGPELDEFFDQVRDEIQEALAPLIEKAKAGEHPVAMTAVITSALHHLRLDMLQDLYEGRDLAVIAHLSTDVHVASEEYSKAATQNQMATRH